MSLADLFSQIPYWNEYVPTFIQMLIIGFVPALLVVLVGPLIRNQVGALLNALPDIVRQFEQVWLPNIAELLDMEVGEDVGIGAFVSRYGDMAGTWGTKVLVGLTQSGSVVFAAILSLFLVPKFWVNEDTSLGERNGAYCTNLEDKMGLKGSATCEMTFGERGVARGVLVGDVHNGIRQMFRMLCKKCKRFCWYLGLAFG